MITRSQNQHIYLLSAIVTVLLFYSSVAAAKAPLDSTNKTKSDSVHVVKEGQTLGEIAEMYGISAVDLANANNINNLNRIDVGQELRLPVDKSHGRLVKTGVIIELPKGFTLWDLSLLYDVSVDAIIHANRHNKLNPARLQIGQKILIPGARHVLRLEKKRKAKRNLCLKPPVTLYRVRNDENLKISLCHCNGRPNRAALDPVSHLARALPSNRQKRLHPRLLQMLQAVAEKFPGRRIEIISGYRTKKRAPSSESRHLVGRAIDFRVAGIKNSVLRDHIRKFKGAGVGYYPNSIFVHMDVRDGDEKAYWWDYSGNGEPAMYAPAGLNRKQQAELKQEKRQESKETLVAKADG